MLYNTGTLFLPPANAQGLKRQGAHRCCPPHLLVVHDLARLHGAHDGGVDGVLPVLGHILHDPLLLVRQRRQHDLR